MGTRIVTARQSTRGACQFFHQIKRTIFSQARASCSGSLGDPPPSPRQVRSAGRRPPRREECGRTRARLYYNAHKQTTSPKGILVFGRRQKHVRKKKSKRAPPRRIGYVYYSHVSPDRGRVLSMRSPNTRETPLFDVPRGGRCFCFCFCFSIRRRASRRRPNQIVRARFVTRAPRLRPASRRSPRWAPATSPASVPRPAPWACRASSRAPGTRSSAAPPCAS